MRPKILKYFITREPFLMKKRDWALSFNLSGKRKDWGPLRIHTRIFPPTIVNFCGNNSRRSSKSQTAAHLCRVIGEQIRSDAYRGEWTLPRRRFDWPFAESSTYAPRSESRNAQRREREREGAREAGCTNFPGWQFSAKRLLLTARVRNLFINLPTRHARKSVHSRLSLCSRCMTFPFILHKARLIQTYRANITLGDSTLNWTAKRCLIFVLSESFCFYM